MNILLITDHMDIGGAETHIATLARGLRRHGAEVSVLSSGGRTAASLLSEGIPQYFFPVSRSAQNTPDAPLFSSPLAFLRAQRELKKITQAARFDILHAHARLPARLIKGCASWGFAPIPIVTAHAAFSASPMLRRLSYWGSQTIAVSEDLRAHLCDRFDVPAEQITVIPNGIDTKRFFPPDPAFPPPPHSILFASRLEPDCSLAADLLCDISPILADRYSDVQITIAGGGASLPRFFHRAEMINRGRPTPLLRTVGSISDMPALMRQNRLFVGVSRAALEAAACGCGVILAGNEGCFGLLTPEDLTPALTNFCCRGEALPTAQWLLREICRLFDEEALLRMSSLAGRRLIETDFNAEKTTERTLALYQQALARKGKEKA